MLGRGTNNDSRSAAVIFDMDGTILRPGCRLQQIHMEAMARAVEYETKTPIAFRMRGNDLYLGEHSLMGFTDAGTVDLALSLSGVPATALAQTRARVIARMCHGMAASLAGARLGEDVLPGVAALVEGLTREGVLVGLSTGNAREVAALKVAAAGIESFRDALGAFGDAEPDRSRIAAHATASMRAAAESAGGELEPSAIMLVGDTPADVRAARANGIRCLVVGTGNASLDILRDAGPDFLASDLKTVAPRELAATLRGLGSSSRAAAMVRTVGHREAS